MKVIPFLSATKINSISEYHRYRNGIRYITSLSELLLSSPDLMRACGYAKYNKFKEHRKSFDALERNVPLSYLQAIRIDMETLKQCFARDMEEFSFFRDDIPLSPQYATILLHSIISRNLSFPENITEQEAIELTRSYCSENRFRGCINYPDFKTIWINRDGSVVTTFYPPLYRITRHWLMVKSGGNMIGMVCIR